MKKKLINMGRLEGENSLLLQFQQQRMFDSKGGTKIESIRNKYKKTPEPKTIRNDSISCRSHKRVFKYTENQVLDASPYLRKQQKTTEPCRPEKTGKICRNSTYQKQNEIKGRISMERLTPQKDYISVDIHKKMENLSKLSASKFRKQQTDLGYRTQRSAKKWTGPTYRQEPSLNVKNPNTGQHNMDSLQCIKKIEEVQQKIKSLLLSH